MARNLRALLRRIWAAVVVVGLVLGFATPAFAGDQKLPVSPLTIQTGNGDVVFQVELADTPETRRRGLMHRTEMAPDAGMLFNYHEATEVAMWMKDTIISLDMVFISDTGEIIRIQKDTEPYSLDVIPSGGAVQAVLELKAGTTDSKRIKPGDRVIHHIFGEERAGAVSGQATVVDGDTITIQGREINLFNIDAPELDQQCRNRDGSSYPCGHRARYELSLMTAGREVSCRGGKIDRAGQLSSPCFVDGLNISREMVARGWALVFRTQKYDEDYMRTEKLARKLSNGLWRGSFDTPWDWRNRVGE